MSIRMTIELKDAAGAETVIEAIDAYKVRLRNSIHRTQRHLAVFEQRYGVTTAHFLTEMAAEDLKGGDLEYVDWAGEASMLNGLTEELQELEHVQYHLP